LGIKLRQKKKYWPPEWLLFEREQLEEMIDNNKIIVPQLKAWIKQIDGFVDSGKLDPFEALDLIEICDRQIHRAELISKIYKKRLWK
jgi:hypothetical protein